MHVPKGEGQGTLSGDLNSQSQITTLTMGTLACENNHWGRKAFRNFSKYQVAVTLPETYTRLFGNHVLGFAF